ncbi:MAG: phosphodiester glycosidase family protein [Planctomycetota bacterium]
MNSLASYLLVWFALPLAAQQDVPTLVADTAAWQVREVGEGAWLRQRWFPQLFTGPQSVTVLEVRLVRDRVYFDVAAPGRRTLTSAMGQETGALAAINGGFFEIETDGRSRGLLRLDGVLVSAASAGQGSLGIDGNGTLHLQQRPAGDWPQMPFALGAGPMLLHGGKVVDHGERQRAIRHPRSALGTTADARVLCVTVDGRTDKAVGMSFEELATLLVALGCNEALNLDGGGSTTLWVAGLGVCNFPCDNKRYDHDGERTVANAVLLHAPAVVVVDDDEAELGGAGWLQRTDGEHVHGADFAFCTAGPGCRASFGAVLPFAGRWRALAWAPELPAALGPWRASLPGVEQVVERAPRGGAWVELGEFDLGKIVLGKFVLGKFVLGNDESRRAAVTLAGVEGKPLLVDAVRFVQASSRGGEQR